MRSTIGDRTFRAAQALAAEGRWARSYHKLFESADTQSVTDWANRLYAVGDLRQAADLLTQSGCVYPVSFLETAPFASDVWPLDLGGIRAAAAGVAPIFPWVART
jgi:hypothetical protein